MPIWHIGKRREALTGNSEVYKKEILRFLSKRGYYLKADSYVEATFADSVLTKKGEVREYWLEAKATKVSLHDKDILAQIGKYLAAYLRRTPENRFQMILACYNITDSRFFNQIFELLDSDVIEQLAIDVKQASNSKVQATLEKAKSEDIVRFFEDATLIIANPSDLKIAEEKITPSVPKTPTLPEAQYATQVLQRFGDIEPLSSIDTIYLNLFKLSIPQVLYYGDTPYRDPKTVFYEKPNIIFPAFVLYNGRMLSFWQLDEESLLSKFVYPDSVTEVSVDDFDRNEKNRWIIIRLLNLWIKGDAKRLGLHYDRRTQAYYFPRRGDDEVPTIIGWRPKSRFSRRELTKPMKTDGKINYWVHRAAEIFAKKFWGTYYLQIRPRWLFSSDGRNMLEGPRADKLDRAYRKSIYNRNLNQLYDVLFWFRFIFSETDVKGNFRLDNILEPRQRRLMKVVEQVSLEFDRKPNVEEEEEIEKLDIIEAEKVQFLEKPLDEFM